MNFTFNEWASIKHDLEVAAGVYEKQIETLKPSEEQYSLYQIYTRQLASTLERIARIENAVL